MDLPVADAANRVGLITEDLSRALASYVRSILSGDSPYDRFVNGERTALSTEQQAGLQIFRGKGNCTADLARIGAASADPANGRVVEVLLEEARRFIEWTADTLDVDTAAELVDLQLALTLWLRVWEDAQTNPAQRALLAHEANCWSERVLALSGLMTQPAQP